MWRDWFLDSFFKKFLLPSTMVLFFHSFGGGRCFILVFLDPSSFLCHSILFQGTDFPLSFQKSPLPLTITTCFHTWTRAARSISLQNPSLPTLIPCWGIDSIYLLKSLLCHPSLFSHSVLLRLLSKYYPSILWWGGFAYFLALPPYPPWFPSLLALSYHTLKGGTPWSISSRKFFSVPIHSPLSSLTLLHFSLKVLISIYLFKSSL